MREHETTLQTYLCQIAQAQFVTEPPENDEQNDIGRIVNVIARWRSFLITT